MILITLGEVLRVILPKFGLPAETRFLVYGLIMICIMRFKPSGILPHLAGSSFKSGGKLARELRARLATQKAG